jgi:predicted GIY-YIG superfamily endonuclease
VLINPPLTRRVIVTQDEMNLAIRELELIWVEVFKDSVDYIKAEIIKKQTKEKKEAASG